jgi:squalene-hopene/tetraprenyl-beta-curcumene cyclase
MNRPKASSVYTVTMLIRLFASLFPFLMAAATFGAIVGPSDLSFANEIQRSIDRGIAWLQQNQNSNGYWSTPDQPAVTALALAACQGNPARTPSANQPKWLRKGYGFILSCAKPDGSIYQTNLVTYNTSLCMLALVAANNPEYEPILRKARAFLVGIQGDFGEKGAIDTVFDGGIGYGSKYEHSDMGNTLAALEALYYTRRLSQDKGLADNRDLNWPAAIQFLQNCQNLPAYNKQSWASDDPENKGGFVYYPGQSMAGSRTNANGRIALRSYGSISYAGMLSYIYCDLKPGDPRVMAVFDWLQKNYTLEENPGMGPQGLFFYFNTMSKALSLYGVDDLPLANQTKVNWRHDLAMKLINLQQRDGSWENSNGRWWEKDPALVTAYALLTLERIHRSLL